MTKLLDIAAMLARRGDLARPFMGQGGEASVLGLKPDREAGPSDLSWLSTGVLARTPERLAAFAGAALLVPDVPVAFAARCPVLVCKEPRAAFMAVIEAYFPQLARVHWPSLGQPTIDRSAVIATDAFLAAGVVVGPGVVIGSGAVVGPNTVLYNARIGARVRIGASCTIGLPGFGYHRQQDGRVVRFPHIGDVAIGDDVEIGSNTCIDRGTLGTTRIGAGTKIDNLVHVAHNVEIGADCVVIAHAMIAGSCRIGDRAWIAPSAAILNQMDVGDDATIGLGAVVIRPVAAGTTVVGNPARALKRKDDSP